MIYRQVYSDLDITIAEAVANELLILYVQPPGNDCPNCELIKNFLSINKIDFVPINIRTVDAATEIAMCGKMPKITPILQRGNIVYYSELWQEKGYTEKKTLDMEAIKQIIDPDKKNWIDVIKEHECKDGVCSL